MATTRNGILAAALSLAAAASASGQTLDLIEELPIEGWSRVNQMKFIGISGLDYDPQSDLWFAVSNDPGDKGPVRFFGIKMSFDIDGILNFEPIQAQALNHADGTVFEPGIHRPGGVRVIPADPVGDEPFLVWSSEGALDQGNRAGVFEMCTGATFMDWFKTGDHHDHTAGTQGPRVDRGWESLALMPDHSLIGGYEQPLLQDGDAPITGSGTNPVRLVHFDYWTADTIAELAYTLDEPGSSAPEGAERSLVELIAVDQDTLLSVESVMVPGQKRSPRAWTEIFLVELADATDVRGMASLKGQDFVPVSKRLLGDTDSLGLKDARYDAGAFWHTLEDGRQGLVLISDNGDDENRPSYLALLAADGIVAERPFVERSAGRHGVPPGPDSRVGKPIGPYQEK